MTNWNIKQFFIDLYHFKKNANNIQEQRRKISQLKKQCNQYQRDIIHAARIVEEQNQIITGKNNELIIIKAKLELKNTLK